MWNVSSTEKAPPRERKTVGECVSIKGGRVDERNMLFMRSESSPTGDVCTVREVRELEKEHLRRGETETFR